MMYEIYFELGQSILIIIIDNSFQFRVKEIVNLGMQVMGNVELIPNCTGWGIIFIVQWIFIMVCMQKRFVMNVDTAIRVSKI